MTWGGVEEEEEEKKSRCGFCGSSSCQEQRSVAFEACEKNWVVNEEKVQKDTLIRLCVCVCVCLWQKARLVMSFTSVFSLSLLLIPLVCSHWLVFRSVALTWRVVWSCVALFFLKNESSWSSTWKQFEILKMINIGFSSKKSQSDGNKKTTKK